MPAVNAPKTANFNNFARLSTLPATGYSSGRGTGAIAIYLPHLPEDLEITRENQYQVTNTYALPDGLHIYQSTSPLELSLAFSLHAFDDLCPEGGKTLLAIAAQLHALELPAKNDTIYMTSKSLPASGDGSRDASQEAQELARKSASNANSDSTDQYPNYPPAVSLSLIKAGANGLGIDCVGFIRRVSVKLHAPFLQTADGNSFNIPSAATYEFTFVHNPSYTNKLTEKTKFVNAFGPDVLNYFYNTGHLTALSGNEYADVEALDPTRQIGYQAPK